MYYLLNTRIFSKFCYYDQNWHIFTWRAYLSTAQCLRARLVSADHITLHFSFLLPDNKSTFLQIIETSLICRHFFSCIAQKTHFLTYKDTNTHIRTNSLPLTHTHTHTTKHIHESNVNIVSNFNAQMHFHLIGKTSFSLHISFYITKNKKLIAPPLHFL